MSNPKKVIAIAGNRGVGKDTLCGLFKSININCKRYAFADQLKKDLEPFIKDNYNIDIWNPLPAEKELIRPLLIAHGCVKREVDVDYWAKRVVEQIKKQSTESEICILTDLRFLSEVNLLKNAFSDKLFIINVSRNGAPSPTNEEEKHFREVAKHANHHLQWGNDDYAAQMEAAKHLLTLALA